MAQIRTANGDGLDGDNDSVDNVDYDVDGVEEKIGKYDAAKYYISFIKCTA